MGLEKERSDAKPFSGLVIEETKLGAGVAAHRGDRVSVRYSGFLNRGDAFLVKNSRVAATGTL